MLSEVVSSRYAQAFLQYVKGSIGLERGARELIEFKQVLTSSPEFKVFIESPDFAIREKFALIDKIVQGNFPEEIGHFLKLLIEKNRIDKLSDVIDYVRINYGGGGAVSAVLTSALPLDNDLMQSIKSALEKHIGRKINLFLTFAPELLGGFKVKIGNRVFDASLRRQLAELRASSSDWRKE